jgi:hypothetical protein
VAKTPRAPAKNGRLLRKLRTLTLASPPLRYSLPTLWGHPSAHTFSQTPPPREQKALFCSLCPHFPSRSISSLHSSIARLYCIVNQNIPLTLLLFASIHPFANCGTGPLVSCSLLWAASENTYTYTTNVKMWYVIKPLGRRP